MGGIAMNTIDKASIESFSRPIHRDPNKWAMNTPFQFEGKTIAADNAKILILLEARTAYPKLEDLPGINHKKAGNVIRFYHKEITENLSIQHTDGYQLPELPEVQTKPCTECSVITTKTQTDCEHCFGEGITTTTDPRFAQIATTQFNIRQLHMIRNLPDVRVYYPAHQRIHFCGAGYIGCCMGIPQENYIETPLKITL